MATNDAPQSCGFGAELAISVLVIGLRATCPFGGEGAANSRSEGS